MKRLSLLTAALLGLASAQTLTPQPARTLSFPAGRDVQPVAFSEDGDRLLTRDEAGLTLWQVSPLRPLWRQKVTLKWWPRQVRWEGTSLTLLGMNGQTLKLAADTGKPLGEGTEPLGAAVRAALGVGEAGPLVFTPQGIWKKSEAGIPFEVSGGELVGFYTRRGDWLATKARGYGPVEVCLEGKKLSLDTIFPALGFETAPRQGEMLSFSPDGRWLAWSAARRVTLWALPGGEKRAVLRPDPYTETINNLQVTWAPGGELLLNSDRTLWRYRIPGASETAFTLQDTVPAPKDALIRMVSARGAIASGVANALLLSRPGEATPQTVGPVPQRVFFSEDGNRTLTLSGPTLWLYGPEKAGPLALRLPDFAEGERLTLTGDTLTVYGRDLSWTPGTEPKLTPSIWQANLSGLTTGQTVPLKVVTTDPRPGCDGGQWLTPVLTQVRLCQSEGKLSGWQGERRLWSLDVPAGRSVTVTPDGQWFALATEGGELRLYRAATGQTAGTLTFLKSAQGGFYPSALRVDAAGRWVGVQSWSEWLLGDVRAGNVRRDPALNGAKDLAFVGERLAVVGVDTVTWFEVR
ncbi:hypothetical protein DEIPH_ctg081orf0009 [Deinococcus phoenicis]|uniref:Uncharacterized protein n=1 Tax=Deinococcus phoenicis TaxID=1476583 RepID=A0A016QKX6_9DEIO|nr:PD40 domain-containing protein [Deinococcus phoenicis]EYB66621.1 hypothetical protein DEIPH_ctg081orf0009 [Deinococcus phoenicis]